MPVQDGEVSEALLKVRKRIGEMGWDILDRAMQMFGAMGVTKELPLSLMAGHIRTMRIYDGPTEIHNWVVARNLLGLKR